MDSKQCLMLILLLNLAGNVFGIPEYVYKFGSANRGREIYMKSDWIGWFRYTTLVTIPTPPSTGVSYVKVTVRAINPPKVDYDEKTKTVTIHYSFVEVTRSSYSVYAEGVPLVQSLLRD